jgi:sodium/hydrogen antiporter
VINRDAPDLERGEVTVRGDETPVTEKTTGSGDSQTQTQEEQLKKEKVDDMKEEMPPDGMEILAEWKEGPHKVIERRAGPGEEVSISHVDLWMQD